MEIKPKVCRNLFGSPTPEERVKWKNEVKEELAKDSFSARTKWNFDTDKDVPLEGPYQWQIELAQNVPSFYTKGYAPTKFRIQRRRDLCNVSRERRHFPDSDSDMELGLVSDVVSQRCENCDDIDNLNDSGISSQNTSMCNNESSVKLPRKLKQTEINSFMKKRKRPCPSPTVKRLRF